MRVTKGSPDDEELAAVVIALEMVAARPLASAPAPVSKWKSSLRTTSVPTTSVRTHWHSRG
jgi:hypothetical protein